MASHKKTVERLEYVRQTVYEFEQGLIGNPFTWGTSEWRSKEVILAGLGFILVSESKLKRGGHRLKKNATPVGKAYFGAPIRKYANLYVLGLQTEREIKWYDLWEKGKALLEHQLTRGEYGMKPLPIVRQPAESE